MQICKVYDDLKGREMVNSEMNYFKKEFLNFANLSEMLCWTLQFLSPTLEDLKSWAEQLFTENPYTSDFLYLLLISEYKLENWNRC